MSHDVLPCRGPDLAWPQDDEDGVLGEGLEVLPVLHLGPVRLQHHPDRLHHSDTELVPTFSEKLLVRPHHQGFANISCGVPHLDGSPASV